MKKSKQKSIHHFFQNTDELIIFMIWALFVTAFLVSVFKLN